MRTREESQVFFFFIIIIQSFIHQIFFSSLDNMLSNKGTKQRHKALNSINVHYLSGRLAHNTNKIIRYV